MLFDVKLLLLINLPILNCEFMYNKTDVCDVNELYSTDGDLKIALIVNDCYGITPVSSTYINAAVWTIERINVLNLTKPLSVGISIFQTCIENDYYNPVYKLFRQQKGYVVGALSTNRITGKIYNFAKVLGVNLVEVNEYHSVLAGAAVKLLLALNLADNVTVCSENRGILHEFYKLARMEYICITHSFILDKRFPENNELPKSGPIVIFSGQQGLRSLLTNITFEDINTSQLIFALLGSAEHNEFPERSYVIQQILINDFVPANDTKLTPSPLFFEVAGPFLNILHDISNFVAENCSTSKHKLNCLHDNPPQISHRHISLEHIVSSLKLEADIDKFVYKIYQVENITIQNSTEQDNIYQLFTNIFTYHILNDTLINLDFPNATENFNRDVLCPKCRLRCDNFIPKSSPKTIIISYAFPRFGLRSESWVFAFLAVSILGVTFCVAIFIFLIVRFCKRDILEGNPFLTLLLLFSVMLMYCSVVTFTLDSDKEMRKYICLAQALATTLTYAFAFSLLLSRSILLATISKEVGFMSHVPGPIQSFLTLFMFGVQGALSLQFINHCEDIFRVFVCPINTRTQRNYKEGKHFTVAVVLIAFVWSCWIPLYAVLRTEWKDPILCLGLVSTASIFLGTIFIPRTYMMTVAAARDRLTCALPSLPATTSMMDVYRASTQPVYDCINIAAINARSMPPPPPPQPEIYSNMAVSLDDDFDFERCITPTPDKITRF